MNRLSQVLVVLLIIVALIYLLLPFRYPCGGYIRSSCKNNLKQIGLAFHNYHDEYRSFPLPFQTQGLRIDLLTEVLG